MSIEKLSKMLLVIALVGFMVMIIFVHLFLFQKFAELESLKQVALVVCIISMDSIIAWSSIECFKDYKKEKSD